MATERRRDLRRHRPHARAPPYDLICGRELHRVTRNDEQAVVAA
jgi:hypothetical protein